VNLLTRRLAVVLFTLGLFGASGCAEDNESEALKVAKTAGGSPGVASEPKVPVPNVPAPTSSDGAFQQNSTQKSMPSGYPGQSKRK
jgi:hypothetical protein